ncbi:MAG: DNA-directed RNA polymerase subunit alpha [Phycisphaerales bacterium]|nr:DNA-directed RNA polymerase subunit alpha [Phycisphaerales bacterium]
MAILNFQRPEKIIVKKQNDFAGDFEFRPLEPGYGLTVGNALRRVLLSGLDGYAITNIKIEGVSHEFSTIKGVKDDVTNIILNLKQVRFKPKGNQSVDPQGKSLLNQEVIRIRLKNKTVFKAEDIGRESNYFEVKNPQLEICVLDSTATLNIDILVERGRGYVSAEDNKKSGLVEQYISIDSIHTPITNVRYVIENYRVEQKTDFEKLILEIKTDGTIGPEEAIKDASKILIQHLMLINDSHIALDSDVPAVVNVVNEETLRLKKKLKTPLEELDLSVRAYNCLKSAKINTLAHLVEYEKDDLLKFRNFGQKSLNEIEQMLGDNGLKFGMRHELEKIGAIE